MAMAAATARDFSLICFSFKFGFEPLACGLFFRVPRVAKERRVADKSFIKIPGGSSL
jgi:hypothetical protein